MPADLVLCRSHVTRLLAGLAAALIGLNVTLNLVHYSTGQRFLGHMTRFFDVEVERSLPTWFSSMLLLFAAVLIVWIAAAERITNARFRWHWMLLATLFLALSIDEVAGLHESLNDIPALVTIAGGSRHFAWVLPGGLFVLTMAGIYVRLLLALPRRVSMQIIVAGALFIGGCIGLELIGGSYARAHGYENLAYRSLTSLEESCEIAGVIVFIDALLRYLAFRATPSAIRVLDYNASQAAANPERPRQS